MHPLSTPDPHGVSWAGGLALTTGAQPHVWEGLACRAVRTQGTSEQAGAW